MKKREKTENKKQEDRVEEEITISEHPFKRNYFFSAIIIIFLLVIIWIVFWIFQSPLFAALAAVFLLFSLSSFFLPSRYILSGDLVRVERGLVKREYPLSRFRNFAVDKNGIFLSPFKDASKFDNFRGIFLVMDKNNREKLIPHLEKKFNG